MVYNASSASDQRRGRGGNMGPQWGWKLATGELEAGFGRLLRQGGGLGRLWPNASFKPRIDKVRCGFVFSTFYFPVAFQKGYFFCRLGALSTGHNSTVRSAVLEAMCQDIYKDANEPLVALIYLFRSQWWAHAALAVPKNKTKSLRELGCDVARCCGRVSYGFQHGGWMRVETAGCEVKIRARDELRDGKRARKWRTGARTRPGTKTRLRWAARGWKPVGNELCCRGSTVQDSC